MKSSSTDAIEQACHLITQGERSAAKKLLESVSIPRLTREARLAFARAARRACVPDLGVRALHPLVRGSRKSHDRASQEEITEYAGCLVAIGSAEEALALLHPLTGQVPEAWLFQNFALAGQWRYEEAIVVLREYLRCPELSDDQRDIGKVNLAAALIYERHHFEATPLLGELLSSAREKEQQRLEQTALSLAMINCLLQAQWEQARRYWELSQKRSEPQTIQEYLARKWEAILSALETKSEEAFLKLSLLRKEGAKRQHWESVRDCDRFEAIAKQDERLLVHLFFGTPFERFRKWLLLGFGRVVDIPEQYYWALGAPNPKAPVLSLTPEKIPFDKAPCLKPGELLHRLLCTLASDFYRPFQVATLFRQLYPDEFYHPSTSPRRVHSAIVRLREWCRKSKLPLEVAEEQGHYRLKAVAPLTVLIPRPGVVPTQGLDSRQAA